MPIACTLEHWRTGSNDFRQLRHLYKIIYRLQEVCCLSDRNFHVLGRIADIASSARCGLLLQML